MSEQTYLCFHCLDIGVIVRDRTRSDGRPLGTFGSPCPNCRGGESTRREWIENGLREAARENERCIDRLETLVRRKDGQAEAERWRSAARSKQQQRERDNVRDFKPIRAGATPPEITP
jgi:hypothetical protein